MNNTTIFNLLMGTTGERVPAKLFVQLTFLVLKIARSSSVILDPLNPFDAPSLDLIDFDLPPVVRHALTSAKTLIMLRWHL